MAASARLFKSVLNSRTSLSKGLIGSTGSRNLIKLVQGSIGNSLKGRALSQLAPCLALQASRKFAVSPINMSILDKCFIGKLSALTVAVNESENTSVEETDEDDEATLYILSEMFSRLTICTGDG